MMKMRTPISRGSRAPAGFTNRITTAIVAVVILALLVFAAAGCKDKRAETTPAAADDKPVTEEGKSWGGWRWKGKRNDCFFVFKNRCFDDEKKACKAAKCKPGKCSVEGGGPATISCKS